LGWWRVSTTSASQRRSLVAQIGQVSETTAAQKAPLQIPQVSFDEGLVVGLSGSDGYGLEAIVGGEGK
jgi:hypothetical protein